MGPASSARVLNAARHARSSSTRAYPPCAVTAPGMAHPRPLELAPPRLPTCAVLCAFILGPAQVVTYNTLIDVYGKTGQWSEALAVLRRMEVRPFAMACLPRCAQSWCLSRLGLILTSGCSSQEHFSRLGLPLPARTGSAQPHTARRTPNSVVARAGRGPQARHEDVQHADDRVQHQQPVAGGAQRLRQ